MAQVCSDDARIEPAEKQALESALVGHRNAIIRTLASEPANHGPVLVQNRSTGKVVWADWILGFEYAARLCRAGWARIEARNASEIVEAVELLQFLYALAKGDCEVEKEQSDKLDQVAPALICAIVCALNGRARSGETAAPDVHVADLGAGESGRLGSWRLRFFHGTHP